MTTNKHIRRIVALVTAAAALLLTASAYADSSRPAGMGRAEYRALMIRSEALNDKYGLGRPHVNPSPKTPASMTQAEYRALMVRSAGLNQKYRLGDWKGVPQGMTPAEYHALMARSEGLNKQYHLGKWSVPSSTNTTSVSTDGFSWQAFGIGAAAMLGLVLLAGGVIAGSRHTSESPSVRAS